MTDNEIIKALECCQSEDAGMCRICPFHSDTYSGCWYELHKDALDLINRQKAEIERLNNKLYVQKERLNVIYGLTYYKELLLNHISKNSNTVKCKECEYLMFSDMYGECSKGYYKGIVSPNDSCGKGKLRVKEDKQNERNNKI